MPCLDSTIKEIDDDWLRLHEIKASKMLFHYTTIEGLRGIIENRSLWFTDIDSVNDPMELHYGKKIIEDEISKQIKKQKNENIISMLKDIQMDLDSLTKKIIHRPFIACFCENDNLLSQWRGYSAGNGGYCLGFQISKETKYWITQDRDDEINLHLRKVIYNEKKQRRLINKYLRKIIIGAKFAFSEINENVKVGWIGRAATRSVNILLEMMLSFKSPYFKEEKEWRFIAVFWSQRSKYEKHKKFKERDGHMFSYHNIWLANIEEEKYYFPLKSIMHSPVLEKEYELCTIKQYLDNIRKSENSIILNGNIDLLDPGYKLKKQS